MSHTVGVGFRSRNLWFYDQSLAVWLVCFLEKTTMLSREMSGPFNRFCEGARRAAALGAIQGLEVDDLVDADDLEAFASLAVEVSGQIRSYGPIEIEPIRSMTMFEGMPPIIRDATPTIPAGPVASVGDALAALVRGTLPKPPAGTWWYVGETREWRTIKMGLGLEG
jgi:hypothetical protein